MSPSVRRRLATGFGAQALGPIVTMGIQLLNVPLYLSFWGADLYGEWLILSAMPSYLSMSDVGFGTVAGNDMMMKAAAGDRAGAAEVFRSCTVLVVGISFLLLALVAIGILILPFEHWLNLTQITGWQARQVLLLLSLDAVLCIQPSLILNGFKAANQFAFGTLLVNIMRAVEGGLALAILCLHGRPVHIALSMVCVRIAGTILMALMMLRVAPWLSFSPRGTNMRAIRALTAPAFAFMTFPLANAASIQGMTIVLGIVSGPIAVASFGPIRTLSRGLLLIVETIKNSIWPELSYAIGCQDWVLGRKIFRIAMQISVYLSLIGGLTMAALGPWIFAKWTHGRVAFSMPTFLFLLVSLFFYSVWNTSSVALTAANKHERLAVGLLVSTFLSLAVAFPMVKWLGLPGAPLAQILIVDIPMTIFVLPISCRLLQDSTVDVLKSCLDPRGLQMLTKRFKRS
jgi:O-antigen/teichoic acid export membrane protein